MEGIRNRKRFCPVERRISLEWCERAAAPMFRFCNQMATVLRPMRNKKRKKRRFNKGLEKTLKHSPVHGKVESTTHKAEGGDLIDPQSRAAGR
jgi:hypothetical protein